MSAEEMTRRLVMAIASPHVDVVGHITNRKVVGRGRPGSEFDAEIVFAACARFDTAIEPSLGLGMIINPTEWFQNEEIQLLDVRDLERDAFVEQVRQLVRESPHRSLLVVVNGFRERFISALRKTAFLAHVLDVDSPLLVFDWPGDQGSTPRGYGRAQRVAAESGAELAETLELVIREVRPERLWLVANSMGGEVVVHAFGRLHGQADLADAQTEIEDVVRAPARFGRRT